MLENMLYYTNACNLVNALKDSFRFRRHIALNV